MTRARPASRQGLLLAELALASVTAAVVLSFTRLFTGTDFVAPLLGIALGAHLLTAALRRRGVALIASLGVVGVAFALAVHWVWLAGPSGSALPGPASLDTLRLSLEEALNAFREVVTPVPASTGFLVVAAAALVVAVFLADWAAFRLWSAAEALIPPLLLFLFSVVLGTGDQRVPTAMAFAATCLLFLLAHRLAGLERRGTWVGARPRGAPGRVLGLGLGVLAVAVLGGALLGPALPGSQGPGAVSFRGTGSGSSNRVVVSPLVDIRQRIVDQSDLEAFTVRADRPEYWRLTALDTFDGAIWRSGGRFGQAGQVLDAEEPSGVSRQTVAQEFAIKNLSALWLPAAFQPVALDAGGANVRYQASSSTLIVDTDTPTSDSLRYAVTSQIPSPTAAQLAQAAAPAPEDLANQLELPASMDPSVVALAEDVVQQAQATNPYRKALALQQFFRDEGIFAYDDHEFTYVLGTTVAGHSTTVMADFLASGEGYCEQFAGTYAAMARAVGLPARVAVGFTWGEQDPADPSLYHVKGRYAHAWPEVWLGPDVGWIAFEPTPGRGAPSMGDYAEVSATQASGDARSQDGVAFEPAPLVDEGPAADQEPFDPALADPEAPTSRQPVDWSWVRGAYVVVVGLAVLGLVYAAVVPALLAWRRRRRHDAAIGDPASRVQVAWQVSAEQLALVGVVRRRSETYEEFARRAAAALPDQAPAIAGLAQAVGEAAYAPRATAAAVADDTERASGEIARSVEATASRARRLLARVDPRPLWQRQG